MVLFLPSDYTLRTQTCNNGRLRSGNRKAAKKSRLLPDFLEILNRTLQILKNIH